MSCRDGDATLTKLCCCFDSAHERRPSPPLPSDGDDSPGFDVPRYMKGVAYRVRKAMRRRLRGLPDVIASYLIAIRTFCCSLVAQSWVISLLTSLSLSLSPSLSLPYTQGSSTELCTKTRMADTRWPWQTAGKRRQRLLGARPEASPPGSEPRRQRKRGWR